MDPQSDGGKCVIHTRGSLADVISKIRLKTGRRPKAKESNFSYRLVTFAHRFVSEEPCRRRRFIARSADGIAALEATDVDLLFPMSTDGCCCYRSSTGRRERYCVGASRFSSLRAR